MTVEEVKRAGPNIPQDIEWGLSAYCNILTDILTAG